MSVEEKTQRYRCQRFLRSDDEMSFRLRAFCERKKLCKSAVFGERCCFLCEFLVLSFAGSSQRC